MGLLTRWNSSKVKYGDLYWYEKLAVDTAEHLETMRSVLLWVVLVLLFMVAVVLYLPTISLSWLAVKRLRNYWGDGKDYFRGKGKGWIPEDRSIPWA